MQDGLTVLRRFRQLDRETPVLFLTVRDAVSDRVRGLDGGADDYLCKPFAFDELLARRHESFERQRQFAGDASHQLRTPLAGLLSLIEVIRRRQRSGGGYEQALDQVHGEAVRLRQIVESLLFLARAEAEAEAGLSEASPSTWPPGCPSNSDDGPAIRAGPTCARRRDGAGPSGSGRIRSLLSQLLDNFLENAVIQRAGETDHHPDST